MVDNKFESRSPVVESVASHSDSDGSVTRQHKKAPWWSYFWVGQIEGYTYQIIYANLFEGL